LDTIVSVDAHFLTFCRSVCSYARPGQVKVIPNGVDASFFVPSPGSAGKRAAEAAGCGSCILAA